MDKYKLLENFLQTWPIERLRSMKLEEYTNLNRQDSFCYWLEQRTNELGGITGGSSFKFGIYKRNNTDNEITISNALTDGEYAWFQKYGDSKEEAFHNVRNIIVQIAEFATNKEFDKIEEIDFGESTKWKIAFLYSEFQLINTFSKDMVCSILDFLNIEYSKDESRFSLSQKILSQKKEDEDFFEFGSKFWNVTLISQELKKILENLGERLIPYFEVMDRIVEDFNLEPNNEKYYFNYRNKGLIFTIGQRYIWNVTKNKYKYISLTKDEEEFETFGRENQLPDAYLNYSKNPENFSLIYERMSKCIKNELEGTLMASHRNKNKKDLQELVFNKELRAKIFKTLNISNSQSANKTSDNLKNTPLNQILYGPPGTGKTYALNKKFFAQFTIQETSQSREQYLADLVASLSWWQVITLALLDMEQGRVQEIYAHELIKQKELLSNSKTIVPTIWGQLQSHTVYECPNVNVERKQQPLYFYKDENSIWSIRKDLVEELYPEALELYNAYKTYQPSPDKIIKNYEFVTFHQSFSYEDFIEGIKPDLEDNEGEVKYKIEPGVFKRLCERAKNDPSNSYALFIDEINRGNVSQIFGELITLIEEDKRIGKSEELYVTLPYSKEKFGVPSNLYIIGTMNTADRSVEAIDTALRRRFSFEEMPPRYDLEGLQYTINGIQAWEILKTINARIESLIDRDHAIGHAYFLNKNEEAIMDSFYRNIIPLLQEYFFGDYGKIGLVLGKGFVRVKDETVKFAHFNYEGFDFDPKETYEIIDYRKDNDQQGFLKAISMLMNRSVEE